MITPDRPSEVFSLRLRGQQLSVSGSVWPHLVAGGEAIGPDRLAMPSMSAPYTPERELLGESSDRSGSEPVVEANPSAGGRYRPHQRGTQLCHKSGNFLSGAVLRPT